MDKNPVFDPGEEVYFDVANYGRGRGNVAGFYRHTDGTKLYAVYPKTERSGTSYQYLCLIVPEADLISAPF